MEIFKTGFMALGILAVIGICLQQISNPSSTEEDGVDNLWWWLIR
ncbi:hypothetical protein ACQR1I_16480 [Bradyrhizobium sp. HKCCYLS2038]